MKEILSSSAYRQLEFIELLFLNEGWMTVDTVSQTLNCSPRIIRSDIQFVNQQFQPFQIEVSIQQGIRLTWPSDYSIDYIYATILEHSSEFKLLEEILFDETNSLEDLSEKLYLSDSTIKRMVRRLNTVFSKQGVKISGPPFRLVGNELRIRFLYSFYLMERYTPWNTPLTTEEIRVLTDLVDLSAELLGQPLTYHDSKLAKRVLLTCAIRFKHGHHKEPTSNYEELTPLLQSLIHSGDLAERFNYHFGFPLTEHFFYEVFSNFLGDEFPLTKAHLFQFLAVEKPHIQQVINRITQFLERLAVRVNIELDNHETIIFEIFKLQQLLTSNNYVIYDKKELFVQQANKTYPLFMPLLKEELSKLKLTDDFIRLPQTFNELLFTLITNWPELHRSLEKSFSQISIGIFCDYNVEYSIFLKDLIAFHFSYSMNIVTINSASHVELYEDSLNYDIILTDSSSLKSQHATIICVTPIPSTKNWQLIQAEIVRLSQEKGLIIANLFDTKNK